MAERAKTTGRVEGSIFDTIRSAGLAADNILIGDGDHTKDSVNNFKGGRELIQSLAEAGASHLCLEVSSSYDGLAQEYYRREITREQFLDRLNIEPANPGEVSREDMINRIADQIDYARQFGMQVHFVDPIRDTLQVTYRPETQEILQRAIERYISETGRTQPPEDFGDFWVHANRNNYFTEREAEMIFEDVIASRVQDGPLYDTIQRVTNGEKTAVIYGAGHDELAARMSSNGSLLVVDVHANRTSYDIGEDQMRDVPVSHPEGQPDLVYMVDTNQTYLTDQADTALTGGLKMEAPGGHNVPDPPEIVHTGDGPDRIPQIMGPG
ncbi:MAG: hypothetical protein H6858_07090 [Rhodospirillales bacterium]|nr:hypothetical protein [Alphaproteobacteria bacterium]MCB9977345.1 hypothetical protein [Rhodospirillales bacterium]